MGSSAAVTDRGYSRIRYISSVHLAAGLGSEIEQSATRKRTEWTLAAHRHGVLAAVIGASHALPLIRALGTSGASLGSVDPPVFWRSLAALGASLHVAMPAATASVRPSIGRRAD